MSGTAEGGPEPGPDAHHVGSTADFEVGDSLLVEVEGIEVALYNTPNGFYAMANYCVHQGGPLCEGPVSGSVTTDEDGTLCYDSDRQVVKCPWHGWEFDVESGEHLSRPQYNQPTYEVLEDDGELYVRW
jgi:nitrite reductase/ring-hydroxylating ferredoxin subunit